MIVVSNMGLGHRNLTWTLMPLFLAGALCNSWRVEYQQKHVCAVKGSSVVIPCSFYFPDDLTVKTVVWGHVKSHRFISGSDFKKASSKFQYIGDKHRNCSLKIHQVEHHDAGKYAVRFNVNGKKRRWPGSVAPVLKVVDLNIVVTRSNGKNTTKEGDSVNLTCINGCDGDHLSSAFSWFKNGELIKEGPVLNLSNVSSTNSGNYTCSLKTQTETTSEEINIDVEYGPKNTSVSVRPSMEVDAGSNTTLMCSSHANPPVKNYTWFKIDENEDIMDVGQQPVFVSGEGGQFLCRATNKHGSQNSSVVTVKIKPHWKTLIRGVVIISAVAVLLIGITVISNRRKRKQTPRTDCDEDIQNSDYVDRLTCDNNQSQEGNQCEGGTTEVVYAAVDFNKKTKTNRKKQMDSHNDEDVIYSTVCRFKLINPSCIEPL